MTQTLIGTDEGRAQLLLDLSFEIRTAIGALTELETLVEAARQVPQTRAQVEQLGEKFAEIAEAVDTASEEWWASVEDDGEGYDGDYEDDDPEGYEDDDPEDGCPNCGIGTAEWYMGHGCPRCGYNPDDNV